MLRCSKSRLPHTVRPNVSDRHAVSEKTTHSFSTCATVAWIGVEIGARSVAAAQPGYALLNKDLAAMSPYVTC